MQIKIDAVHAGNVGVFYCGVNNPAGAVGKKEEWMDGTWNDTPLIAAYANKLPHTRDPIDIEAWIVDAPDGAAAVGSEIAKTLTRDDMISMLAVCATPPTEDSRWWPMLDLFQYYLLGILVADGVIEVRGIDEFFIPGMVRQCIEAAKTESIGAK